MSVNLVRNPSFEDNSDQWRLSIGGTGTPTPADPFTIETVDVYDGTKALRCHVENITDGYCQFSVFQIFQRENVEPFIPGEQYRLRLVYKSDMPLSLILQASFEGTQVIEEKIDLPAATEYTVGPWLYFTIPESGIDYLQFFTGNNNQIGDFLLGLFEMYGPPALQYALTINAVVGGTTDPPPGTYTYNAGAAVTVTAYSDPGQYFQQWTLNGEVHRENPINVTMNRNITLTPSFTETPPPPAEVGVPEIAAASLAVANIALVGVYLLKHFKVID